MAVARREMRGGAVRFWTARRLFAILLQLAGAGIVLGAAAALAMGAVGPLIKFNYDAFAHLRLQFSLMAFGGAALMALGGGWRGGVFGCMVGVLGLIGLGPAWETPAAARAECVAARITVAAANVHDENPDFDRLVDALLAADADILSTEESIPRFWSATTRLRSRYPYRLTHFPGGGRTRSVMLWSKLPIAPLRINEHKPDAPGLAMAEISLAGRPVAISGLHGARPVIGPQQGQYEGLAPIFAKAPGPRIVMGDFNATLWSHAMAVAERGLGAKAIPGYRTTWRGEYPNPIWRKRGWKPPAIIGNQIDHILVSKHFGVERIETFDLPGSVHSGVKATLQLRRDEPGCS